MNLRHNLGSIVCRVCQVIFFFSKIQAMCFIYYVAIMWHQTLCKSNYKSYTVQSPSLVICTNTSQTYSLFALSKINRLLLPFRLWNLRVDAWVAVLQINSRSGCPHQCVVCSGRSSMTWDFNNILIFLVRGLPAIVDAIANGMILMFWGLHGLCIEGACNFSISSLGDGTTTPKTVSVILFIFEVSRAQAF